MIIGIATCTNNGAKQNEVQSNKLEHQRGKLMTVVLRVLNVILLMINDNDYYDDNEEGGHDIVGIDDHDDYSLRH